MRKLIKLYEPVIGTAERRNVMSALKRREISGNAGEFIGRFEHGFAKYCSCEFGIAVTSGTSALHLAMAAIGIGPGDKVIVSSFTNMATFFAVLYLNAVPVPVDIDRETWNVDPSLVEDKVDERTKAIIPVHIYGHPVDMDLILKIASQHELQVAEDCAEAHGATYKGKKVGSLGDVGCFSFYGNKIITTGEGGMLTTNSSSLAERARSLRTLAFGKQHKFMHEAIGYNYRMTNLQAAIGCAQVPRIETIIKRKRAVAAFYNETLADVPGLQLPVERDYAKNVYWMYHLLVEPKEFGCTRAHLMEELGRLGVETRESFVPFNLQEIFLKQGLAKKDDCPVANYVAERGFYLPSGPLLTRGELNYVVQSLRSIQKGSKGR